MPALDEETIYNPERARQLLKNALSGRYAEGISLSLPLSPPAPLELCLLPSCDAHAHYLFLARQIIGKRLESGWYEGRLVLLNAQPHSGAAALEHILEKMINTESPFTPDLRQRDTTSISLAALLHIPNGGVLSGCYTSHNYHGRIIERCKARVCTLLRHPADIMAEQSLTAEELAGLLHWMSSWLARGQNDPAFHFLRYEDLEADIIKEIQKLCRWLHQDNPSAGLLREARKRWPGTPHPDAKRELNPESRKAYNATVKHFAAICPNMGDLLHYYPDLLSIDSLRNIA
ncbi:MAG: sulfotransferase domain-containing protein [Pseudomonadota bacterium]|nr:sulfotransferase domain-containing protein [Pseudomonadota bacterium]